MEFVPPSSDPLSVAGPAAELLAYNVAAGSDPGPSSLLVRAADQRAAAGGVPSAGSVHAVPADLLWKRYRFQAQSQHRWRLHPGSVEGDPEVEPDIRLAI